MRIYVGIHTMNECTKTTTDMIMKGGALCIFLSLKYVILIKPDLC